MVEITHLEDGENFINYGVTKDGEPVLTSNRFGNKIYPTVGGDKMTLFAISHFIETADEGDEMEVEFDGEEQKVTKGVDEEGRHYVDVYMEGRANSLSIREGEAYPAIELAEEYNTRGDFTEFLADEFGMGSSYIVDEGEERYSRECDVELTNGTFGQGTATSLDDSDGVQVKYVTVDTDSRNVLIGIDDTRGDE